MYPNGYIIVDCAGVDLNAESSTTITGLNASLVAAINSGKPVIAFNIVNGDDVDEVFTPIPVVVAYDTTTTTTVNMYLPFLGITVSVTSADLVTVTVPS